jgi:hypothetical protein
MTSARGWTRPSCRGSWPLSPPACAPWSRAPASRRRSTPRSPVPRTTRENPPPERGQQDRERQGHEEVRAPVGDGGDAHGGAADPQRVDLRDHQPEHRPGAGGTEVEAEQAHGVVTATCLLATRSKSSALGDPVDHITRDFGLLLHVSPFSHLPPRYVSPSTLDDRNTCRKSILLLGRTTWLSSVVILSASRTAEALPGL